METQEVNNINPSVAPVPTPVSNNVLMGVLCYLGVLVVVPIVASKDVPFIKFHIKQGLILAVGEVGLWVLGMFAWNIIGSMWWSFSALLSLVFFIFSIVGIVNVLQAQEKPLPYIGHLSANLDPYLK